MHMYYGDQRLVGWLGVVGEENGCRHVPCKWTRTLRPCRLSKRRYELLTAADFLDRDILCFITALSYSFPLLILLSVLLFRIPHLTHRIFHPALVVATLLLHFFALYYSLRFNYKDLLNFLCPSANFPMRTHFHTYFSLLLKPIFSPEDLQLLPTNFSLKDTF